MRKHYINSHTKEDTKSASQAMKWYRDGDTVQVNTFYNEPHKTGLATVVHIPGARVETSQEKTDRENRTTCRRIAEELEAYARGEVYRCPDCGEIIILPDDVGNKYKCPDCGTVSDVDGLEQLGLYDYFEDALDIEYRIGSDKQLRSVQIMVACGGPNIYIDTHTCQVELYWWGDRASFPIDRDVCGELEDWAEELYLC